jgi:hypothetical protein
MDYYIQVLTSDNTHETVCKTKWVFVKNIVRALVHEYPYLYIRVLYKKESVIYQDGIWENE